MEVEKTGGGGEISGSVYFPPHPGSSARESATHPREEKSRMLRHSGGTIIQ